jgi:hypothetical protein
MWAVTVADRLLGSCSRSSLLTVYHDCLQNILRDVLHLWIIHLWSWHETPPQFVNSWTACSRNERREDMLDLRWSLLHQEFLVSKTILCRSQWLCGPRRMSEAAWFWDRGFSSSCGHGRSLLLFVVYYVGSGLCDRLITRAEESLSNCLWSRNLNNKAA